jgi:hypothetical protein
MLDEHYGKLIPAILNLQGKNYSIKLLERQYCI